MVDCIKNEMTSYDWWTAGASFEYIAQKLERIAYYPVEKLNLIKSAQELHTYAERKFRKEGYDHPLLIDEIKGGINLSLRDYKGKKSDRFSELYIEGMSCLINAPKECQEEGMERIDNAVELYEKHVLELEKKLVDLGYLEE